MRRRINGSAWDGVEKSSLCLRGRSENKRDLEGPVEVRTLGAQCAVRVERRPTVRSAVLTADSRQLCSGAGAVT